MAIRKFQFIGSFGKNTEPIGRKVCEINVDGVRFVPLRTCEGCAYDDPATHFAYCSGCSRDVLLDDKWISQKKAVK